MNSEELLKSYASGIRNFQNISFIGQSFTGQNLTNVNFSHTDIRGTNFRGATLVGADFSYAKAGLPYRWVSILGVIAVLLAVLAATASTQTGIIAISTLTTRFTDEFGFIPSAIVFISLTIFTIATVQFGIPLGGLALTITISVAVPLGGLFGPILAGTGPVALAVAWFLVGSATIAMTVAVIIAVVESKSLTKLAAATSTLTGFTASISVWIIARIVTERGDGAIAKSLTIAATGQPLLPKVAAFIVSVLVLLVGGYIGLRAMSGDERFALIRSPAATLASWGGTCFYQADLSNANLTGAILRNTDLRSATLRHACWFQARKLNTARIGFSYLDHVQVRDLLVTANGQGKQFDRMNLQGLNLCHADLSEASFIGANLSNTQLQDTNLSNAKLIQTQLDQADLTGACLTGAYIQDWGITTTTKLEGVECRYVYMRLPTVDNPDPFRKPDNTLEEFGDGDFADFIAPLVKTLDLYHNQDVDPRAVAIAFKRLIENNPESELELLAMERRGRGKFLLRAKTTTGADLSSLNQEYFDTYNHLKALPRNDPSFVIADVNERVRSLEAMILGLPTNIENRITSLQDAIRTLANTNNCRQKRLSKLLLELQRLIEVKSVLLTEDRAEVIEQLKAIAEAGVSSETVLLQQMKTPIRFLKGMMAEMPAASNFVREGDRLLQEISHLFDLE